VSNVVLTDFAYTPERDEAKITSLIGRKDNQIEAYSRQIAKNYAELLNFSDLQEASII
jgi:hypothetical protein